jgi:hypothetical protein
MELRGRARCGRRGEPCCAGRQASRCGAAGQAINPWTFMNQGAQFGLVDVDLGQTTRPDIERERGAAEQG